MIEIKGREIENWKVDYEEIERETRRPKEEEGGQKQRYRKKERWEGRMKEK